VLRLAFLAEGVEVTPGDSSSCGVKKVRSQWKQWWRQGRGMVRSQWKQWWRQ
jgi:hypothetical protein